jgi:predicted Fe-Mo cluster-binding NifX family protein
MAWRIAVTSADGVLINQHFGHAKWFFIIDVQRDVTGIAAERRTVTPWCQKECGDESERDIAENLRDCVAVLTAKIGAPARKLLELAGIAVFEETVRIDGAVKKLAAYYTKTNRPEADQPGGVSNQEEV